MKKDVEIDKMEKKANENRENHIGMLDKKNKITILRRK